MPKFLIIALSTLLALGLFSEKYLPFVKELLIGVIFIYVLSSSKNLHVLNKKIKTAVPLLLIFLIFLILGALLPYHIDGYSVINFKFLTAILFFIFLSTFFSIYPKLISTSLISFGIGVGILSILFAFNILGESSFDIRNDRLFFLGENPNSLSVRVSLGILFLIWGIIENGLKLSKIFRFSLCLLIPFMFNLLLVSGSKGSFILCVLSVIIYIVLLKNISKRVKKIVVFIASIVSVFVFFMFLDSALYGRFLSADITSGRTDIWGSAYDIFANNPFGVGEIGYNVEINRREGKMIDTHNLFLYLAVAGGLFSLILFIYFLAVLLVKNIKQYKKDRNIINLIIFFSMVFIMSKTGGVISYLIMWYFLACINVSLTRRDSYKLKNEI